MYYSFFSFQFHTKPCILGKGKSEEENFIQANVIVLVKFLSVVTQFKFKRVQLKFSQKDGVIVMFSFSPCFLIRTILNIRSRKFYSTNCLIVLR